MKFILLFFYFLFWNCNSKLLPPKGVPQEAVYEKRQNIYYLKKDGHEKQWSAEGWLYSDCELDSQGAMTGLCKTYSKEGQVISEGKLVNGNRDGVWQWYFLDGKIYTRLEHNHEKKRIYWMSTQKIGNEHGFYERFYSDGQLELKGYYDSGYMNGKWEKYYRSGKIEYQGEYLKEKKIGEWFYYYPNGSIEAVEKYNEKSELVERKLYLPDGKERSI